VYNKPEKAVKKATGNTSKTINVIDKTYKNKNLKMFSLTFSEATKLIYRKEGATGFLRGFTPSVMKSCLNSATYFSLLYYSEEVLKSMSMFTDGQTSVLSSGFARTI
jgi:hypothetical protein